MSSKKLAMALLVGVMGLMFASNAFAANHPVSPSGLDQNDPTVALAQLKAMGQINSNVGSRLATSTGSTSFNPSDYRAVGYGSASPKSTNTAIDESGKSVPARDTDKCKPGAKVLIVLNLSTMIKAEICTKCANPRIQRVIQGLPKQPWHADTVVPFSKHQAGVYTKVCPSGQAVKVLLDTWLKGTVHVSAWGQLQGKMTAKINAQVKALVLAQVRILCGKFTPKPAPKPVPPAKPAPCACTVAIFGSKIALVDGAAKTGLQFYLQVTQGSKRFPVVAVTTGAAPKLLANLQSGKPARACEVNLAHSLDGWVLQHRCITFMPTGVKYIIPAFVNSKTTPKVPAPQPASNVCTIAGVGVAEVPNGFVNVNGICQAVQVTTLTCNGQQIEVRDSSGVVVNCINITVTQTNGQNQGQQQTTAPAAAPAAPALAPTPAAVTFSPSCSAVQTANKNNREFQFTAGGSASNGSSPTGASWSFSKNSAIVGTASGLSTTFTFSDNQTTYNWQATITWSAGSATCSGSVTTGPPQPALPGG